MSELIITIAPTIMDGRVVRWYRSESAARHHNEVLSASRNGVLISAGVYLHEVPDEVLADAKRVWETLRDRRPDDWVTALATHRYARGTVEPIAKSEVS